MGPIGSPLTDIPQPRSLSPHILERVLDPPFERDVTIPCSHNFIDAAFDYLARTQCSQFNGRISLLEGTKAQVVRR